MTHPYHPWDWYMYLHLPCVTIKNQPNVGIYPSPMDSMGQIIQARLPTIETIMTQVAPGKAETCGEVESTHNSQWVNW